MEAFNAIWQDPGTTDALAHALLAGAGFVTALAIIGPLGSYRARQCARRPRR